MSLDVHLERSPCDLCGHAPDGYGANITHNLTGMARAAGIYSALWHPEDIGVTQASQLIPLLEAGMRWLTEFPAEAASYDAVNGWGTSENLISFVEDYLAACKKFPAAAVSTCT